MADAKIFVNKDEFIGAVQAFMSSLPADTKSIQCCVWAYTDDYDNYDEKKTKCVAEEDAWWNLPEEEQMELLGEAVSACLKQVNEFVLEPAETEADLAVKDEKLLALKGSLKSLARSFALYTESVDTAAIAGEQLDRLFSGILAFQDREVFKAAFDIFRKKKGLEATMEDLQWHLMAEKKPAQKAPAKAPQKAPAVKATIPAPAVENAEAGA